MMSDFFSSIEGNEFILHIYVNAGISWKGYNSFYSGPNRIKLLGTFLSTKLH